MDITSLGLKNIKVVKFEPENGSVKIILENDTSQVTCPTCNNPSSSVKDRRLYRIITNPVKVGSHPIDVFIQKRLFKCSRCHKSFTEQIQGLKKYHVYTDAFDESLETLFKHMDYPTIQNHLFDKYELTVPLSTIWYKLKDKLIQFNISLQEMQNAIHIGLDEFSYAKGHSYGVMSLDLDKHKIVDMVAGGKDQNVAEVALSIFNPAIVEACCIDLCEAFKNACYAKFPHAIVVADKFHVIKLLNEAIKDIVNKKIIPTLEQDSQRKYLRQYQWVLLKGKERLSDYQRTQLPVLFQFSPELKTIYEFKEQFRYLYTIKNFNIVYPEFNKWLRTAKASHIPELIQVAKWSAPL